jgi:hypothetical protein
VAYSYLRYLEEMACLSCVALDAEDVAEYLISDVGVVKRQMWNSMQAHTDSICCLGALG